MATIVKGLQTFLEAQSTITSVVGTRIYPQHLPRNSSYPCLTHQLVSRTYGHHLSGVTGLSTARVQVDCWGEKLSDVETLAEAVRVALDGYFGTIGDVTVAFVQLDNEQDLSEAPQDESEQWLYRRTQDYLIKHGV